MDRSINIFDENYSIIIDSDNEYPLVAKDCSEREEIYLVDDKSNWFITSVGINDMNGRMLYRYDRVKYNGEKFTIVVENNSDVSNYFFSSKPIGYRLVNTHKNLELKLISSEDLEFIEDL